MRLSLSLSLLLVAACAAAACKKSSAADHPMVVHAKYTACAGCHIEDYDSARDHPGVKPTTCGICHTQEAWHPQGLAHPWPLNGAHVRVDCFKCHLGNPTVFDGTPKTCVGCHRAEYDRTPGHAERFPTTCADCHATYVWKPAFWVDTPPAATTDGAPDGGATAVQDAAPAVDASAPKPAATAWRAPPHPTGVPTTRPTTTPTTAPTKPDVTTHPSPRH